MRPICNVHTLGLIEYQAAWDLQERLAQEIGRGERPPTLLLLEHPHVYTFGRSGNAANLLWNEDELLRRGVSVHWVDRGGDVTYHGPGQLVGYPLLPLRPPTPTSEEGLPAAGRLPQADYTAYLRRLEQVILRVLGYFGILAVHLEGLTGAWIPAAPGERPAKIAAIGVKVDARGISRHGFALNVAPDMSYWQGIIGCGLVGYPVTSLAEQYAQLGAATPKVEVVQAKCIAAFGEVFDFEMLPTGI